MIDLDNLDGIADLDSATVGLHLGNVHVVENGARARRRRQLPALARREAYGCGDARQCRA